MLRVSLRLRDARNVRGQVRGHATRVQVLDQHVQVSAQDVHAVLERAVPQVSQRRQGVHAASHPPRRQQQGLLGPPDRRHELHAVSRAGARVAEDPPGGPLMLSLKGSWPSRLLAVSQVCVGIAALLGVVGMATRRPILMLAFTAATGLIVLGVVLFAVVALTAQRGMIREDYGAGDVIVSAGEGRPDVYVISSGTVEIVSTRPDGGEEGKERLSAGAHFHGTALPGGP